MRIQYLHGIRDRIKIDVDAPFQFLPSGIFKPLERGKDSRVVDQHICLYGMLFQILFDLCPAFVPGNIVIQISEPISVFAQIFEHLRQADVVDDDGDDLTGILRDQQAGDTAADTARAPGYDDRFIVQPTLFHCITDVSCLYSLRFFAALAALSFRQCARTAI